MDEDVDDDGELVGVPESLGLSSLDLDFGDGDTGEEFLEGGEATTTPKGLVLIVRAVR